MAVEGLDEALAKIEAVKAAARRSVRAAHAAIVAEFRRQRNDIPRDSGALRKSLLNPRDRAHVVRERGLSVEVGSSVRQARYQSHRLPRPDARRVTDAIREAYQEEIDG